MNEELTRELDSLPENTIVLGLGEDGDPVNTAFRTKDLDGNITWALGGLREPWSSAKLAAAIRASNGSYEIVRRGK